MNNKFAMIIDGDNVLSCSLPSPLVCPNCKNDFWIIYGVDDLVKISQKVHAKIKCHNNPAQNRLQQNRLQQNKRSLQSGNLSAPTTSFTIDEIVLDFAT